MAIGLGLPMDEVAEEEVPERAKPLVDLTESDRWAAPFVLGPRTLWRTWGTRPIPSGFFVILIAATLCFVLD
jgi:hypothetical protein